MMWFYGWSAGGWNWLWMSVMMIVVWGGVIALAVWAIRTLAGPRQTGDAALDALRRRLASGEITPEEFERTRKLIGA